jgi:hypothetical protein
LNGTDVICEGESALLQSSYATGNQWSIDGAIITGSVGNAHSTSVGGLFTVTYTNDLGCSATSGAIVVTVNPTITPTVSIVNATGAILDSGSTGAFYVKPIRDAAGARSLRYDPTSGEITHVAKTFVIQHPTQDDKYLVHACLEGPEVGVYYRGKGEIVNNKEVTIQLPDYVKRLANDFTIQITPIYSGEKIEQLYTSEVFNNSFTVYGENAKFYWLVHGKRSNIEIEPLKSETILKGTGISFTNNSSSGSLLDEIIPTTT